MKIAFLTRSLEYGGAERQLTALAAGLRQRGHEVTIVSLYDAVPLAAGLAEQGVNIEVLGKRGRWDVFGFARRLARLMKELEPDVIHSYMPGANLIGSVMRPLLPRVPLVWGVRSSDVDLSKFEWLTRLVYRAEPMLARVPVLIIINSQAGREYAVRQGYPGDKMVVVPNGIDVRQFHPDQSERMSVRREWRIAGHERLIGLVGRLDPFKDHPTFLRAAALIAQRRDGVRFVCVGDDPSSLRASYEALADQLGIASRVQFHPARRDIRAVYCALDVLCSSSYTEGFPNVIAEAMASGTRCVATDAGDSKVIIGDEGVVVPRRDAPALADGVLKVLDDEAIGQSARDRIVREFSLDQLVARTEEALLRTVSA